MLDDRNTQFCDKCDQPFVIRLEGLSLYEFDMKVHGSARWLCPDCGGLMVARNPDEFKLDGAL